MIITIGVLVVLVAVCIGGMLIARNNREKVDTVVDKSEAIIEILKK